MSKFVKQLQIKHLRHQFEGLDDLVVVNVVGLDAIASHQLRMDLRKKGIQLQVVKNSLAKKVFGEKGLAVANDLIKGSAAVAWGGVGIVELAKEIADWAKKLQKLEIKGACVAGQAVDAKGVVELSKLPSRAELLGRIVMLAQSPAARVAALALSPARQLASQIKEIAEPKEEPVAAAS